MKLADISWVFICSTGIHNWQHVTDVFTPIYDEHTRTKSKKHRFELKCALLKFDYDDSRDASRCASIARVTPLVTVTKHRFYQLPPKANTTTDNKTTNET